MYLVNRDPFLGKIILFNFFYCKSSMFFIDECMEVSYNAGKVCHGGQFD